MHSFFIVFSVIIAFQQTQTVSLTAFKLILFLFTNFKTLQTTFAQCVRLFWIFETGTLPKATVNRYQSPSFETPRPQTRHGDVEQRERQIITSLISILYHLPLSTIVIHVPHVSDFIQRWQRLFRELQELGLTDMNGGAIHHSVRIVLPRSSSKNMTHVVRGDVIFTIQKGAFILLGTDTVYNVTGCLQSHLIEEEAGLLLNEGTTIIIGKVRENKDGTSSAKRLERLDMCRLNESLPDLLDSSVDKELITLTSTMKQGLKELQRSPLGRLTGAFDEWNKYIYV